jgi:uncharacterized protein YbcI
MDAGWQALKHSPGASPMGARRVSHALSWTAVATPAAHTDYQRDGQLATAISTMVVGVLREHTGRGPTKSRARISDELIWVVVQDTLTRAEHTLVANGQAELVLRAREAFQDIMRADLIAGVETLTGRSVTAFFSDNALDPDIAVELFLLAPRVGAVVSESERG